MEMTQKRLFVLTTVDAICNQREGNCASPTSVAEKLDTDYDIVAQSLHRLKKVGWLQRPFWGCYRLSKKGRELMVKALGQNGEEQ